ncbi:S8 family serine peptidase [Arthrobacter sp. OAP107]|uniref:S8 family serine peptidase n=1 Tax=Arthrobacter sp. OAP107 TaxID=3156445 RepID=UPI00339B660B
MPISRGTRLSAAIMSAGIAGLVASALIVPAASASDGDPHLPSIPRRPSVVTPPTDQLIVKFKDPARSGSTFRADAFGRAAATLGATAKDVRGTAGGARVIRISKEVRGGDADKLLASLRANPAVAYAEPDVKLQAKAADPADTYYWLQWNLQQNGGGVRATRAWDVTQGAGQVVAVLDTGITKQRDLGLDDGTGLMTNVLPGYDMIANADGIRDADPTDPGDATVAGQCGDDGPAMPSSWHGTHVAGIIAAVAGNNEGIAGLAPKAKILPVRVLGPCGGQLSDIADAIVWASGAPVSGVPANRNPARVINLSLGGPMETCPRAFQSAIDTATARGSVVVAAAGNEMTEASGSSPANCNHVISVAASGPSGALAPYSNFGPGVDITAPGGDMTPTSPDDPESGVPGGIPSITNDDPETADIEDYDFGEGTSYAAPHVSAAAALLIAQMGPTATPAAVEARLKRTARPITGGCPQGCGAGRLDAASAVLHFSTVLAAGDLTGDGKPDVLARENSGYLWLYPGNGRGGWLARQQAGTGWNSYTILAPGDFNGDKRNDILARDRAGAIWLYPGNGHGGWLARVRVGSGWNGFTAVVGPGDLNGDGKTDVLARDAAGALWLYPGNGHGGWLARTKAGSGWNGMTAVVGPGDLTGDRKADLLARDAAGILWRYPGNGRGGFGSRTEVGAGWNSMTAITGHGDYNGDARADILAVDTSGTLWLYRGNGAGWFPGRTAAGNGWG